MIIMKISAFIYFFIICEISCRSLNLTSIRRKRWENGDMGNTGDLSNMFRGTAGVDYPDLKSIPNTSFRCEELEPVYEGGLYADVETKCQVYHVCHDGRKDSFLCGRGTIFNQQILACDYWYSAECDNAPSYYHLNAEIGNSVSPNNLNGYSPHRDDINIPQNTDKTGNKGMFNTGPIITYNAQNKQPCRCLKNSFKTSWSFPASMIQGRDK